MSEKGSTPPPLCPDCGDTPFPEAGPYLFWREDCPNPRHATEDEVRVTVYEPRGLDIQPGDDLGVVPIRWVSGTAETWRR